MSKKQMDWLLSELSQFESYSLVVLVSSRHWIGEDEVGRWSYRFDGFRREKSLGLASLRIERF